jgi:hypothetical protein
MRMHLKTTRVMCVAMFAVALTALALAGTASAKLTGEFKKFEFCPYTNPSVERCLYSVTTGGEVVLGNKKVPIEKQVVLQGGYEPAPFEGPEETFSKFVAATNGITLSKAPQKVPGGLAGFVNCKEISNFLLRLSCEAIFENGLTGVNSILELAKPASEIRISEIHLSEGIGVALKMPVKIRLENPFLGESCYVGSSSTPVKWELTSGKTNPPPPNTSIKGKIGSISFLEEAQIIKVTGNELVDNAWSAPAASGCGGIFSFIIDPIVNSSSGLPAAAGKNTAKLQNEIWNTFAVTVQENNANNP